MIIHLLKKNIFPWQCYESDYNGRPEEIIKQWVENPQEREFIACLDINNYNFYDILKSIKLEHGGNNCEYIYPKAGVKSDFIRIPFMGNFVDTSDFFSKTLHEAMHWVEPRKHWKLETPEKELIAEIGMAFLCDYCGLPNRCLKNAIKYRDIWIIKMKNPDYLINAVQKAQEGFLFLSNLN